MADIVYRVDIHVCCTHIGILRIKRMRLLSLTLSVGNIMLYTVPTRGVACTSIISHINTEVAAICRYRFQICRILVG